MKDRLPVAASHFQFLLIAWKLLLFSLLFQVFLPAYWIISSTLYRFSLLSLDFLIFFQQALAVVFSASHFDFACSRFCFLCASHLAGSSLIRFPASPFCLLIFSFFSSRRRWLYDRIVLRSFLVAFSLQCMLLYRLRMLSFLFLVCLPSCWIISSTLSSISILFLSFLKFIQIVYAMFLIFFIHYKMKH